MLVSLTSVLARAQKHQYAVGAFNVNNMEILQAVVRAAHKLHSPVIIQTSEGALNYAGINYLHSLVLTAAEQHNIPIVLHLDHGRNLHTIRACIKKGYTSVMIDGSHEPFEKNIALTKKVVRFAHRHNVSVEGELGTIGGAEDLVSARTIIYTDPEAARTFVEHTGIDALAIALGTSHGAYKYTGAAQLDIPRLKVIRKKVRIPLVLHGASHVPPSLVTLATKYGARFKHPVGVPDAHIRTAIKNGICKINTDTDLRLAFTASIRKTLAQKPTLFDPRELLAPARDAMQQIVEQRIRLFGSTHS